MDRREFLMLAQVYKPEKHKIGGWYVSEKLDGFRCFWDGGLSRDVPTHSVPWANTINPKTGTVKAKIKPIASGLWSRYGNPIMAPDWFLNSLPCCPLDGELWAGRGNFQVVSSTVRKDVPVNAEWEKIQYGIFGCPDIWAVFQDGEIKNTQFTKVINRDDIERWVRNRDRDVLENFRYLNKKPSFAAELANMQEWLDHTSDTAFMIVQTKLPSNEQTAQAMVEIMKKNIIEEGGEGVFIRSPDSVWVPKRVHECLKCKGSLDAEVTVTGFIAGRETDKGSKLLGLIGALILDFKGKRLELSGFTDEERQFATDFDENLAVLAPGEEMPSGTEGKHFKLGDRVTFTYRELTNDGVPKEARYLRKRNDSNT